MRFSTKVAAVLGAAALTASLGTATAFADNHPTPEPSVTKTFTPPPRPVPQTCAPRPITFTPTVSPTDASPTDASLTAWHGVPTPQPTHPVVNPLRCQPERFVAQITALGSTVVQNRVIASGPVFGTGSDDLSLQTNTRDVFDLPGIFRTVNVDHTGLAFPSIDLGLCVASVNQFGLWRFNGGTGLFRHAIGNGRFLLTGQWVFPTIRGVCSLRFLRGNPILQNRITPTYTNIQVWATGLARR